MFRKKIPIVYLLFAVLLGSAASVFAFKYLDSKSSMLCKEPITESDNRAEETAYTISRLDGYKYTHPLYMAEPRSESNGFIALKSGITDFVEQMKTSGELDYASVYLKNLNTNNWMDVNPESRYHPGSLFKVITMITLLRQAETDLAILNKEVVNAPSGQPPPVQTFNSKTIVPGQTYKVKDLIYYMIVYSDNNATSLLHNYLDVGLFQKTFTDLGLTKPDVHDNNYQLSVKEYSKVISVLYDGGYLTIPASEFAISLLCESDFNLGITKGLPSSVKAAHKFGEAGTPANRELHETAIVYLGGKPYLLTIMTKGKDAVKLAEMISHISKMTYDFMAAQPD